MNRLLPLALTIPLLLAGCGVPDAATDAGPKAGESVLVYGRGNDATSLDPGDAEDGESNKVIINVFDTLIGYDDETVELAPGLATEWSANDDNTVWTFKLRDGVKFHNGEPFTSAAVRFTFERMTDPEHPGRFGIKAPYATDFQVIERIETPDELTAVFHLAKPSVILPRNVAMFSASIVSPKAVMESRDRFKVRPVGTGPFRFVSWEQGQKVTIAANDDHWAGRPAVDRVIFRPILEPAARLRQLQTGELDMADELSVPVRQQIRADEDLELLTSEGLNTAYLTFNTERAPFDDPAVRRAVALAIDKQSIIDKAYEGEAEPAVNLVPKAMWGHADDLADRSYDLAEAKRQLAATGIDPGKTELTFYVIPNPRPYMPSPALVGAIVQESLKELGFGVNIVSPPWGQYLDQTGQGEHHLSLQGWQTDNADPDNFLYPLLDPDNAVPPSASNRSFWKNQRFHELVTQAQSESDRGVREDLYRQAQELVMQEAPIVPLAHLNLATGVRPRVHDYVVHPTGNVYLRQVTLSE